MQGQIVYKATSRTCLSVLYATFLMLYKYSSDNTITSTFTDCNCISVIRISQITEMYRNPMPTNLTH